MCVTLMMEVTYSSRPHKRKPECLSQGHFHLGRALLGIKPVVGSMDGLLNSPPAQAPRGPKGQEVTGPQLLECSVKRLHVTEN